MKTMTVQAKAYDIEKVKEAYNSIDPKELGLKRLFENTFPELAESEDERIRKALLKKFTEEKNAGAKYEIRGCSLDSIISFLERQKEQKPIEWSEEDEEMLHSIICDAEQEVYPEGKDLDFLKDLEKRLKSFRPHSKVDLVLNE